MGRNRFSRETTIEQELREIIKETATGFCIQEIIPQASLPRSGCQPQTVGSETNGLTTTTWASVPVILTRPEVSFDEFEQGKGIVKLEGWGDPTQEDTLWFEEDEAAAQVLRTWTSRNVTTSQLIKCKSYQMVEMWKKTSTVRVKNLVDLRGARL